MNTLAKLDQLNLDADTRMQVQMLFEQSQKEIHSQQLKIQALTMELAYLRRNLFGKKSESLSTSHPDLFEETLQSDLAAVNAEIEQLDPSAKADRPKHRVPVLAANHYRITCHALSTGMSRNPVNAVNVVRIWLRSALLNKSNCR